MEDEDIAGEGGDGLFLPVVELGVIFQGGPVVGEELGEYGRFAMIGQHIEQ